MKTTTALAADLREYVRTPLLLVLLAVVPAYIVALMTRVVPDTPLPVTVAGESLTAATPAVYGVLLAPLAASLVAGITGLFVAQAGDADRRLVVAGFRSWQVAAARLALLAGVALAATVAAVAVLWTTTVPEQPAWYVVGTFLAAFTYGLVGALLGSTLDRLPGTYVLLFGPSLDFFLYQNPTATDSPAWAAWTPSGHAATLALDAGLTASVDTAPLLPALGYALVVAVLATLAYVRATRAA